jgi:hypothetical protein
MSLERLYYNDPFSNIVISCDFYCVESSEIINRVLRTAIECFESLGMSISVDDNDCLRFGNVGHKRNLENILFSDLDELSILKSLAGYPFDLQNGETLKIIIQTKEFGYTMYFCMHHIIGDAISLILLIKKFVALMQNNDISFVEINNTTKNKTIELDSQTKYLISTINKKYPRKYYSRSDYLSMHYQLHNDNNLEIAKVILNEHEFWDIKEFCKKLGVSITSYIVSEVFRVQNVETVCLAVNSRESENTFGNFVGRIDIPHRSIEKESNIQSRIITINKYIKSILGNMKEMDKGEEILNLIHPGFYDDVIFNVYSSESNPFAKKMSKFIGYKDNKPTTFVSNLKTVIFDCKVNSRISKLCFYPPHPVERFSTIGIVTQNDQMVITIQKFREEKTL